MKKLLLLLWFAIAPAAAAQTTLNVPFTLMFDFTNSPAVEGAQSVEGFIILTSTDIATPRTNWTQVLASAPFGNRVNHQLAVMGNRLFLIGGQSLFSDRNDVWSTQDGATWTSETSQAATVSSYVTGTCSTAVVLGLSKQISDEIGCMSPTSLVRFTPSTKIQLTSSAVLPYLGKSAKAALESVNATICRMVVESSTTRIAAIRNPPRRARPCCRRRGAGSRAAACSARRASEPRPKRSCG